MSNFLPHHRSTKSQTSFESSWLMDESPERKMRKFTLFSSTENFYGIIHDSVWGPCVSLLPFDLSSHPLAPNRSVLFVLLLSILPSSPPPAINVPFPRGKLGLQFSLPLEDRAAHQSSSSWSSSASTPTGPAPTALPKLNSQCTHTS